MSRNKLGHVFRLVTRSFEHSMFGEAGPVAVYDVSSGVVYLDRR